MREKLNVFDGKQTNWEGLWWHPEYNNYSSASISLAALREFKGQVRFYMRENPAYMDGKNGRPNYLFRIRDAKSEKGNDIDVEEVEDVESKINRLKELMRESNGNANQLMLASESRARAQRLMADAISLIEEITGEEWNFTSISY